MKNIPLTLLMVLAIATFATATQGQTLAERIDRVMEKRAREAEALLPKRELTPQDKILQSLLYTKLSVNFNQTTAQDAFEYLKTELGIELIVHYSDDENGNDINPLTPITLKAEDKQALKLMQMILAQCEISEPCTWQLREDFLEIGTKIRLSDYYEHEFRTYAIEALLLDPIYYMGTPDRRFAEIYRYKSDKRLKPKRSLTGGGNKGRPGTNRHKYDQLKMQHRAEILIKLITENIETKGWERNGGDWATINYHDGTLMVTAPDFIHRQIDGYPDVPPPATSKTDDETTSDKK